MTIESIPKFTALAAKLWAAIPVDARKRLLANVWCGKCRHAVTITNFTGASKRATCGLLANAQSVMVMWRD